MIVDLNNFTDNKIGNKAKNLFLLQKNGFNVPPLFCVLSKPDVSDEAIIFEYIKKHFGKETLFAVRSSSNLEDLDNASFAGQFSTFLNVPFDELFSKIHQCFNSAEASNVKAYIKETGSAKQAMQMTVIVQKMVDADVSGVIFTVNPLGLLNETVVSCGKGAGSVVDNELPATTYYYSNTDKEYYYEDQQNSPHIDDFSALIETTENVKKIFGPYLDIEYAIKDGIFYLLQVRPITTINLSKQTVFDNSNIVESYPGTSLPLTCSFVKEAYSGIFRGVAFRILKSKKLMKRYELILKEMVGDVNGRMYYKITNWYEIINFLPFSKKIIPIWQDMLGVSDKTTYKSAYKKSLLISLRVYFNSFYELLSTPRNMQKLSSTYQNAQKQFDDSFNQSLNNRELLELYHRIGNEILKKWDITLLNDLYSFIFTGLVKSKLEKSGFENHEELTNSYISGIGTIESLKPIKALIALVNTAINENAIERLELIIDDESANEFLSCGEFHVFIKQFDAYIDAYGDRTLEELKLETLTFRTTPFMLIQKILSLAGDRQKLGELSVMLQKDSSFVVDDVLCKLDFFNKLLIKSYMRSAKHGIENREFSRLNRCRIYGMMRSIFIQIGRNLESYGLIGTYRDVFYLTLDEIENENIDFKILINKRKADFEIYNKLPAYSRLVFFNEPFNKSHLNINSQEFEQPFVELKGTPCSAGEVTGEVVVITDPKLSVDVKDKIIVTKMTDPGWVFMLAQASGIISEKGSLLSHTAIISRELHIPSIVGVKDAVTLLKTGDTVKMNGSKGEITPIYAKAFN